LIWDLALAALLVWLGHHARIRPPGLFALYVTGYSAFRIYEESLRIDYSEHFLSLRLNTFVASALTVAGIAWFVYTQRRPRAGEPPRSRAGTGGDESAGSAAGDGADGTGVAGQAEAGVTAEAEAAQAHETREDGAGSHEPEVSAASGAQEIQSDR